MRRDSLADLIDRGLLPLDLRVPLNRLHLDALDHVALAPDLELQVLHGLVEVPDAREALRVLERRAGGFVLDVGQIGFLRGCGEVVRSQRGWLQVRSVRCFTDETAERSEST